MILWKMVDTSPLYSVNSVYSNDNRPRLCLVGFYSTM